MVTLLRTTGRHLAVLGYLILSVAIAGGFLQVQQLIDENERRVSDIQEARVASCRQTYEGIREVFKPLFPPRPNPTQQKNLNTFNKTIDDLRAGCARQTQTLKEDS